MIGREGTWGLLVLVLEVAKGDPRQDYFQMNSINGRTNLEENWEEGKFQAMFAGLLSINSVNCYIFV